MFDRAIVALLGPCADATCTTPACGYPDPCDECEERRHRACIEAERAGSIRPNGCLRCDGFGGTGWEPCPECLGAEEPRD